MSENIRSTNLRFNLEKDTQKRAWQYLQNMDRKRHGENTSGISCRLYGGNVASAGWSRFGHTAGTG